MVAAAPQLDAAEQSTPPDIVLGASAVEPTAASSLPAARLRR